MSIVVEGDQQQVRGQRDRTEIPKLPRLLVLDLTARGDGTATGEIKANILAEWEDERYLQIYSKSKSEVGILRGSHRDTKSYAYPDDFNLLMEIVNNFQPELILYRPVPDAPALHSVAMHILEAQPPIPLATWIMDDWPARLEADDPYQFDNLNRDWLWLLERSTLRLSISEKMSAVLKGRYGHEFVPFANGIDPAEWPEREAGRESGLVLRYAGGLAENMTSQSVLRVAEAVEELANEGHGISFEIRTRPAWETQARHFSNLKHTRILTELLPRDGYMEWLRTAGALLIAYNFDAKSLRYVSLSMANKLPECLASGAPVIAHGPRDAATIDYLDSLDCAIVVDEAAPQSVKGGLLRLLGPSERKRLSERAREVAFARHNIHAVRDAFMVTMAEAAATSNAINPQQDRGFDSTLLIVGNGPSLKGFDFDRLRNFDCLGMNAAYRYWHEIGWYPRYYACLDTVVGLSHKDEIAELIRSADKYGIEYFFLRPNLVEALPGGLGASPSVIVFDYMCVHRLGELPSGITTGSHSAVIAALLGYGRLALLGIDCNYVAEVQGSKRAEGYVLEMAETPKENPNYFFAGYQAAGDKYNLPNPSPDLHVRSWRTVAPFLKENGMKIWNCSPISRVDAFPFRDFDEMDRERAERHERPRTLRIDRILAAPICRRHRVGEVAGRLRSPIERALELGHWGLKTLWRRRRGLGGLAMVPIVLPLLLAIVVPSWPLQLLLVGVSGFFALLVLAGLILLRVIEALDARAAAYAREAQLHAEAAAHRQMSELMSSVEKPKAELRRLKTTEGRG